MDVIAISAGADLGIVVAGTLITAVILGIAAWVRRWWRRPVLEMYVGDGPEFDKKIGIGDAFVQSVITGKQFIGARSKTLVVRETRGRSQAPKVAARLLDVDPEPMLYADALLRWGGQDRTVTIQPGAKEYLPIQMVIVSWVETGEKKRDVWTNIAPPILEHAPSRVEFTVELVDDTGRKTRARFRMERAWNEAAVHEALLPPLYDELVDFPYPTLTRVEPAVGSPPDPWRETRDHLRVPL